MDFTLDNTTLPENGDANAEVGKISLLNPIAASKPKIVSEGLGEKLWEFDARGDIKSAPAIGLDGTVYIGAAQAKSSMQSMDRRVQKFGNSPLMTPSTLRLQSDRMELSISAPRATTYMPFMEQPAKKFGNTRPVEMFIPHQPSVLTVPFT